MLVMRSVAAVPEIFLHQSFGNRYLGVPAAAAVVLIPMFAMLMPDHDARGLLLLDGLYIVMCVTARIDAFRNRRKQQQVHSLYNGRPRIMALLPWVSEMTIKKYVEPLIVFVLAVALLPWDQPLGTFLLLAGFLMGGMTVMSDAAAERRALDLSDALIEQEILASRIRAMRRDSF